VKILSIPPSFKTKDRAPYPRHQVGPGLEDRAEEYFQNQKALKLDRIFCPIKWTAYQIDANYGNDIRKMSRLNSFCKTIGNSMGKNGDRYFTIVQYDDGALENIDNCRVFCAGGVGDDPIPLTTERHPVRGFKKSIFASFLGSMGTHPIRKQMFDILKNEDLFIVEDVYTKRENTPHFAEVTEKSCFTLCPRGYGKTSFRLYEAMQLGSVPVYISNDHWLPYTKYVDWSKFCVLIKPEEINKIPGILKKIFADGTYTTMRAEAIRVYEEYFCFESMYKWVVRLLQEEQ
jgi:hypothetical protein